LYSKYLEYHYIPYSVNLFTGTGRGGSKEAKLNEIEHKVLDIIGEHNF
jgi:hypothetical protein